MRGPKLGTDLKEKPVTEFFTANKHGAKVVASASSLGVMNRKAEASDSAQPKLVSKSSRKQRHEGPGRPTHFQAFSDGTLIETVRDPVRAETFRLLIWRGQKAIVADQFEYGCELYLPGVIDPGLAKNLRLPSGIGLYRQPRDLLAEMFATLHPYVDLADEDLHIICVFVLISWFPDCLPNAPYLWLVGPLGSGKTTLLKLLQALCRRAFLIGDLTPASLYQLPSLLSPTLIIDENDLGDSQISRQTQRILRIGNSQGTSVIRNGRAFDPYCVKVLASRQPPPDAALGSRSIIIGMLPSRRPLMGLDDVTRDRIAEKFQRELLMFRLQNFHSLHTSLDFSSRTQDLTPRIRDIAHALARPLLGDVELETDLISMLEQQDRDARIQRTLEPEWLVLEALFSLCHPRPRGDGLVPKATGILVGGIADQVNQAMADRGEDVRLSAKKTGLILRALGFRTKSLGKLGRGLELTAVVREHVHRLSERFGLDRKMLLTIVGDEPEYGGELCSLCEKFGLNAGLKFVEHYVRCPLASPSGPRRALFSEETTGTIPL
jgi:hypothetical protein